MSVCFLLSFSLLLSEKNRPGDEASDGGDGGDLVSDGKYGDNAQMTGGSSNTMVVLVA